MPSAKSKSSKSSQDLVETRRIRTLVATLVRRLNERGDGRTWLAQKVERAGVCVGVRDATGALGVVLASAAFSALSRMSAAEFGAQRAALLTRYEKRALRGLHQRGGGGMLPSMFPPLPGQTTTESSSSSPAPSPTSDKAFRLPLINKGSRQASSTRSSDRWALPARDSTSSDTIRISPDSTTLRPAPPKVERKTSQRPVDRSRFITPGLPPPPPMLSTLPSSPGALTTFVNPSSVQIMQQRLEKRRKERRAEPATDDVSDAAYNAAEPESTYMPVSSTQSQERDRYKTIMNEYTESLSPNDAFPNDASTIFDIVYEFAKDVFENMYHRNSTDIPAGHACVYCMEQTIAVFGNALTELAVHHDVVKVLVANREAAVAKGSWEDLNISRIEDALRLHPNGDPEVHPNGDPEVPHVKFLTEDVSNFVHQHKNQKKRLQLFESQSRAAGLNRSIDADVTDRYSGVTTDELMMQATDLERDYALFITSLLAPRVVCDINLLLGIGYGDLTGRCLKIAEDLRTLHIVLKPYIVDDDVRVSKFIQKPIQKPDRRTAWVGGKHGGSSKQPIHGRRGGTSNANPARDHLDVSTIVSHRLDRCSGRR
jgi:hypothetical protein